MRKAFFFSFLTCGLILLLLFFGLPTLVKLADFFAEIKESGYSIGSSDTLPPPPPRFNFFPEYTNQQSLSLSGFAEPGAKVEIFLNNLLADETLATEKGTFSSRKINLNPGKNEIYGLASDRAGNKSQSSQILAIIFDDIPPELLIVDPFDGTSFQGEKSKKIKIKGKTEKDASLTLNERLIILDKEGNFSADFTLLEGENLIKIVTTDQAGNRSEKEIKVTFAP